MINGKEINLLNVHGMRQLKFCPPHFTQIIISSEVSKLSIKEFKDWLYENLQGRFYIGHIDTPRNPDTRLFSRDTVIAFEIAEEASYFSLILPNLSRNT